MEEDRIGAFFREMRKADEQLIVPPFPERKKTRRLPSFLYAAAAVVTALVMVVYLVRQAGQERVPPGEAINLMQEDELKTRSLIDIQEESLSEWKSPTGYLAEDF